MNFKSIHAALVLLSSTALYAEPYYVCTLKGNVKYVLESGRHTIEKEDYIRCIATGKDQIETTQKTIENCKSRMYKDIYKGVLAALEASKIKVECVNDFTKEPTDSLSFSTEQVQRIKNEYPDFTFKKSCIVEDDGSHVTADFKPDRKGAVYNPFINHQALILESENTIQILMHKNSEEYKKLKPLTKEKMELISEEVLKKKAYKNSYDPENTLRYYYSQRGGVLLSQKRFFYEVNDLASLVRYTYSSDNGVPGIFTGTLESNSYSFTLYS